MSTKLCQCADSGCPVHTGVPHCAHASLTTVYRVDMDDKTGTAMCEECANDAMASGVFDTDDEWGTDDEPSEPEEDDHRISRKAIRGHTMSDKDPNIRVRDLPTQPAPGVMLLCVECAATYSAAQGDYFTHAPDDVMVCCGESLRLVRRRVVLEDVEPSHAGKGA